MRPRCRRTRSSRRCRSGGPSSGRRPRGSSGRPARCRRGRGSTGGSRSGSRSAATDRRARARLELCGRGTIASTWSTEVTFGRVTTKPSGSGPPSVSASTNRVSVRRPRARVGRSKLLKRMPWKGDGVAELDRLAQRLAAARRRPHPHARRRRRCSRPRSRSAGPPPARSLSFCRTVSSRSRSPSSRSRNSVSWSSIDHSAHSPYSWKVPEWKRSAGTYTVCTGCRPGRSPGNPRASAASACSSLVSSSGSDDPGPPPSPDRACPSCGNCKPVVRLARSIGTAG